MTWYLLITLIGSTVIHIVMASNQVIIGLLLITDLI